MNNASDKIELVKGDITRISCDAIVNAANSSLMGGGGVDGAIHRAGGPAILEECRMIVAKQGRCETGSAVITTAGRLPASYVIHTVGPVWQGGKNNEEELLASCYTASLQLAAENKCRSIAFPNISTGIYGFPKEKAAVIVVSTVMKYLEENTMPVKVIFVCFDKENFEFIRQELHQP